MIEEIAIGVLGSGYKDFIFYESLEKCLGGYASDPVTPDGPDCEAKIVKLRQTRKIFVPPETQPDSDIAEGTTD